MNGTPIASCSGTFFDIGGSAGNYSNNQNINTTICPDGTGGTHIRLLFDSTELATGDQLCIRDGSTVFAPVLACDSGFPAGQPFKIKATAGNAGGCLTLTFISDASGTAAGWSAGIFCAAPCTLSASIDSLSPAGCPGASTGSAVISTTGAMGPVQFFVDNNPSPFPNGNFGNIFSAGPHQVIVQDTAGCRDTVNFTILEPPPINITITVTDAKCFGDNSGAISAVAAGGTSPYVYAWKNCQGGPVMTGPSIPDLFAGCYAVTVTDGKGCTAVAQDTIKEPIKFQFSSKQDSVSCFGGMNGMATVFVSGAMPPYTFLWGNGDKTPTADSLKAAFHSVTVTDAIGCQAVTLVQVLQPPRLLIDSLTTTPISCFGTNDGTITVFTKGGVKPYSYSWSNLSTGSPLSNLGPGTYTVTLTDFKGCTVSSNTQLVGPPELVLQLSNIQNESCASACDGSMTLTNSGGIPPYTISWSHPSIPPGTTMPGNLCPGAYTVTVSDSKGCSRTSSATILAAAAMSIQFTAVAPSCAGGQNGMLTAAGMGGTPPFQYLWSTNGTTATIQNLGCGIYTVFVTDARNCLLSASDTLPCATPLQIDSIQAQPVRCFGEVNGRVSVFAKGGSGMLSYLWSDPNQQFDSTAVNLSPGVYTVTVSDANNCTATVSATVTEPPIISVPITPTHITCYGGNNGSATANPTGGIPPYQYNWSNLETTPGISGLIAGTYSLTVVDAYGCPHTSATTQITQPATPVQLIASQTSWACYDSSNGAALATANGSNGPPFTYIWSNGITGPSPSNFASGAYTVTATDNLGCTGTQTVTISERDSIQVNVAFILPTCNGTLDGQAAVNLVSGGAGNGMVDNYSFHWSVPGSADTIYIDGLAGNQNYGLTVTDNTGCSADFNFFLADQTPIIPMLKADSVSCKGRSDGTITLTSIQSLRPIVQYAWSNGGLSQNLANIPAGPYNLVVTDTKGCTGSASISVSEPSALQIQLAIQSLACNNDLNGSVQANAQGGTPGYLYFWNIGTTGKQIKNLGPGLYAVTVSDSKGCTASDSTSLSQPNPPVISLDLKPPTCFGRRNGSAQILVSSGTMPYRYSLDGQNFTSSSVFLGLGAGNYTAYVLDGLGCTTSQTFSLVEPPAVEVDLGPDQALTLGDSILLSPDVFNAVGATAYSWNSSLVDSQRCADPPLCSSIWAFPLYSNVYWVTVTDENGCQGEARVRVDIEKPRGVYVPTGFSPNGDGNNDLLVVYGKSRQIKRVKEFRVYDRWGELVYEDADFAVNDEQRGWNGQFRDQEAQTGTYVWYVEVEYLDGFQQVQRGNTALIR